MLDTETKRRIDTARDILVGKVPDPKSQVEQITIALIYKFMDDLDAESEEFGGKRKFFAGEFARFGWAKLMRSGLGGHDMLSLYTEAIKRMPENPGIPPLFRDIFKNAYLPYNDPETLRAFLKVIDEFTYDHSERLGDAFEYLLSVLGSQGDAGQFRTPRHIIDFIVAVVDPKKDETMLDPACGTAGFLISSYKHILAANTDDEGHSTLTPDDKKRLAANFKGYDISPDMVRLSLVNMYLHGFTDPHIFEYDTLTSDERWNEYADVILANPPFMSPKGGIKPHKRFSVQSKRSEVLFVDYMAEHLTPSGRAGIIVPEGIIFKSQSAHKKLRKVLVENFLVTVVSLPTGVFKPYSGVKTSILIFDKSLAKKTDRIAFFKVENDGFDLGDQRRPIDKNDLPQVQTEITEYLRRLRTGESLENFHPAPTNRVAKPKVQYKMDDFRPISGLIAEKEKIAANGEYDLSGERHRETISYTSMKWTMVKLGNVCDDILSGGTPSTKNEAYWNGDIPWITSADIVNIKTAIPRKYITEQAITESATKLIKKGNVIVVTRVGLGKLFRNDFDVCISQDSQGLILKDAVNADYLVYVLKDRVENFKKVSQGSTIQGVTKRQLSEIQIPLPPMEVQREIVAQIEGYQKVIDSARRLIEHAEEDIKTTITQIWNKEDNKKGFSIPSGLDHIKMIAMQGENNRRLSGSKLGDYEEDLYVLGISLSILYQVSTCHRKCFGGPHVLESLAGRTYNLACSAYTLICRGLYDEALNLIRSMGEISNLIALFVSDKESLELWLHSDKKTRLKKFRPGKVRESLREHESSLMLADQDWYSKFCEDYTHVHPGTRPNVHNEQGLAHAGGFVQEEGLKFSIGELTNFCTSIALFVSKYIGLEDLFKELCEALREKQDEQDED